MPQPHNALHNGGLASQDLVAKTHVAVAKQATRKGSLASASACQKQHVEKGHYGVRADDRHC